MDELTKQKVYKLLKKIPEGKVVTYKHIADHLGIKSPRLVGKILHQNPDPDKIPCHRVVHIDGTLAENYAFGGKEAQKKKLLDEGVQFSKDKVDLKRALYIIVGSKGYER